MRDVFQEGVFLLMKSYSRRQVGAELVEFGEFLIARSEQN